VIARGAGLVVRTQGDAVFAALPLARVGDGVRIRTSLGTVLDGEVVAVERRRVAIATFGAARGVAVGDRVDVTPAALECVAGFGALGRALDANAMPLDGKGPLRGSRAQPARWDVPAPSARRPVSQPLWTGVPALDGLLTLGRGTRAGIFGPAGSGKSMLLEALARGVRSDAVVVALIGERGREAQSWLARLDARTTLLCATGDRSPAERVRAADIAMMQAAALRAAGLSVTVLFDSLARYVDALREQRVALGEPVGRAGYPPSVWFALARLLERAGTTADGSITLLATVLSGDDDERDPLAETARSLLDGHIVLSRSLARAGRFPAVDVLASAIRTMPAVAGATHLDAARRVRAMLAVLAESEDLRAAGMADLSDPDLRRALDAAPALEAFLREPAPQTPAATLATLLTLARPASDR
jgi:FliI/YscN family ATPase